MAKYRKKPIIVEAEQWWQHHPVDGVKDMGASGSYNQPSFGCITTLEGTFIVSPGDWIITTGGQGEKYPCEPGIFQSTYELIEEQVN